MMWVPKDNKFSCNQAFTVFILLTLHYYILKYCFIFCFKNKRKDFISATGFYEVFFDVKKIGTAKDLVPQT